MARFVKTLVLSLKFMAVASVLALGYGFLSRRTFTLAYVFNANFLLGAIIIAVAFLRMVLPAGFKPDKLTDHTTFMERYYEDRHVPKQKKAYEYLFLGLLVIVVTGVIQLAAALAIPGG